MENVDCLLQEVQSTSCRYNSSNETRSLILMAQPYSLVSQAKPSAPDACSCRRYLNFYCCIYRRTIDQFTNRPLCITNSFDGRLCWIKWSADLGSDIGTVLIIFNVVPSASSLSLGPIPQGLLVNITSSTCSPFRSAMPFLLFGPGPTLISLHNAIVGNSHRVQREHHPYLMPWFSFCDLSTTTMSSWHFKIPSLPINSPNTSRPTTASAPQRELGLVEASVVKVGVATNRSSINTDGRRRDGVMEDVLLQEIRRRSSDCFCCWGCLRTDGVFWHCWQSCKRLSTTLSG